MSTVGMEVFERLAGVTFLVIHPPFFRKFGEAQIKRQNPGNLLGSRSVLAKK